MGGKSANIILQDANLEKAVAAGANHCFLNTGQSCNAPTRMLVHSSQYDEAVEIAKNVANSIVVGKPNDEGVRIGPISNRTQYEKVKDLLKLVLKKAQLLFAAELIYLKGLRMGSL